MDLFNLCEQKREWKVSKTHFHDHKLTSRPYQALFSAAREAEDKSAALRELEWSAPSPLCEMVEMLLKEMTLPVSLATAIE